MNTKLSPIALQILKYLTCHQDAQDTVEGIAEWWLLQQRIQSMIREVKKALAELISQRLVVERLGPDHRVHYRVNARNRRMIAHRLRRDKPPKQNEGIGRRSFEAPLEVSEGGRDLIDQQVNQKESNK